MELEKQLEQTLGAFLSLSINNIKYFTSYNIFILKHNTCGFTFSIWHPLSKYENIRNICKKFKLLGWKYALSSNSFFNVEVEVKYNKNLDLITAITLLKLYK